MVQPNSLDQLLTFRLLQFIEAEPTVAYLDGGVPITDTVESTMRIRALFSAFVVTACAVTTARGEAAKGIYTLYRNSIVTPSMRLHVATFDASDGASYNRENCEQARALFTNQAGVKTRFWCEPGRFQAAAPPPASVTDANRERQPGHQAH